MVIFISGGLYALTNNRQITDTPTAQYMRGLHYYEPNQFQKNLLVAQRLPDEIPENIVIRAAIFPHDLAHGEYIAHLLRHLQNQSPSTVILIGPNHYERGTTNILTSGDSWSTPFGTVESNQTVIQKITSNTNIKIDSDVIETDHSINGLLPYLEYYLPQTTIVPLVLKSEVTLRDVEYLFTELKKSSPADAVILAAVDFSHYLTSQQAEINDDQTAQHLQNLDYQKVMSWGTRFNDYLDSPPSIALLLYWVKNQGVKNTQIVFNTNSGILANDLSLPVTSYFEVIYY
jgi:AmmeMemoRadiSam system protein B